MRRTVTLTFDNGPYPDVTPGVLDVLRAHGIAATFFVIGRLLKEHTDLARRALAEGHRLGNHTWSHEVALGTLHDPERTRQEVLAPHDLLTPLTDERLFRPLGGRGSSGGSLGAHLLSPLTVELLLLHQYSVILWNAVPRDWEQPEAWVETAWGQCAEQEHSLVVLHDMPTGAMQHLERFIIGARERGFVFSQEFPESCIPMANGRPKPELQHFIRAEPRSDCGSP